VLEGSRSVLALLKVTFPLQSDSSVLNMKLIVSVQILCKLIFNT
jgi:hypothetical protein